MKIRLAKPTEIPKDWYQSMIGLDIETEDLPIDTRICMVSLHKPNTDLILVVPVHMYRNGVAENLPQEQIEVLKKFVTSIDVVGHNLQFDLARIKYSWGVMPRSIAADTMIIARVLQFKEQGLKDINLRLKPDLTRVLMKFKDLMPDKPPFYYNIDDPKVIQYSGLDAWMPFNILKAFSKQIQENKKVIDLETKYLETTVVEQASEGVHIDFDRFLDLQREYQKLAEKHNEELDKTIWKAFPDLAGWHMRVNATADKKKLLVDYMGLDTPRTTASGNLSMSKESLELMKMSTDEVWKKEIVDKILDINEEFATYNGSKKVPNFVINDRLFFNVEQIGFDGTARQYTKDYAVNSLSKTMRESIIPSRGKKFLYFDYKAAELFIAFVLSKCSIGIEWYNEGKDLHAEVMKILLGKEEVTKADRAISKVLSFSQIYGGTEYTIAKDLNIPIEQAEGLRKQYIELFPQIPELSRRVIKFAHDKGYTVTITGRKRILPDINCGIPEVEAKSERQAFNTCIQGSCADLLKHACNREYKFLKSKGARVAFTVFDSYLIEIPENMTEEGCTEIAEHLSDFTDLHEGLKLRYDWAVGNNWRQVQDAC